MSKPAITNNTELLTDLMEFGGPHGPLTQAFVVYAVRQYAEKCAAAPAESMDSPFIRGAAWKATAEDVKRRMDAFYNRHEAQQELPLAP